MIRVISSPSSSTTGFATLILFIDLTFTNATAAQSRIKEMGAPITSAFRLAKRLPLAERKTPRSWQLVGSGLSEDKGSRPYCPGRRTRLGCARDKPGNE